MNVIENHDNVKIDSIYACDHYISCIRKNELKQNRKCNDCFTLRRIEYQLFMMSFILHLLNLILVMILYHYEIVNHYLVIGIFIFCFIVIFKKSLNAYSTSRLSKMNLSICDFGKCCNFCH